jgi:biopolymer transport protein ExbB/TolQ
MFLFAQQTGFDFAPIADIVGAVTYVLQFFVALWGTYCCIALWRRIAQLNFSNEAEQNAYLDEVQSLVEKGQVAELEDLCSDDPRAVPSMTLLASKNKGLSLPKQKTLLIERFQRDILADLDYRVSWVGTIIKAAPMLGLYGTVVGMMGAFGKLSVASEVNADKLAGDIMFALITTAIGLTTAIPLVLAMASITNRIGRLEDLAGSGLTRILDIFGKQ